MFAHRSNHRYNSGTQISAVTWQTVHEHIVAHTFRSKKISLALLVRWQQAFQETCLLLYVHVTTLIYVPPLNNNNIYLYFLFDTWSCNQQLIRHCNRESLTLSLYPWKFVGQKILWKELLICHVTSCDYVRKGSYNLMDESLSL